MGFDGVQPLDGDDVPISAVYSPQNNTFSAIQGADGAYIDQYGNQSTAPVMSFIQPRIAQRVVAQTGLGAISLSCTFKLPNVGGNSIVICLGTGDVEDKVTSFVVSDTRGNIYTEVAKPTQGNTLQASIFFATGIKLGSNTITVTITGPTAVPIGIAMKAYEVSGLINSVDALDQVDTGNGASSTLASTTAITPVVPNEIAFTAVAIGTITTITPGNGWSTNDGTIFPWGGNLGAFDSQYKQISTIATLTPQATIALSSPWAMACATFRTIVLPIEGTVNLSPATNAPITSVAASTSSVQLIAANTARKGLTVFNDSTAVLYLSFQSPASKTAYTTQVPANSLYEMPQPIYLGALSGIWASANGSARITELS